MVANGPDHCGFSPTLFKVGLIHQPRLATLRGESGESVGEFFRGLCRRSGGCDCGWREVQRRPFGTHQELLHSTGVRGSRAEGREGIQCKFSTGREGAIEESGVVIWVEFV